MAEVPPRPANANHGSLSLAPEGSNHLQLPVKAPEVMGSPATVGTQDARSRERPGSPPPRGLPSANLEIREAAAAHDRACARRRGARRGVEAIDAVLRAVEEHHLARLPRNVSLLPGWRAFLEEEGGLAIPPSLLDIHHTVRLHDALLDWQGELLDDALPGRAALARADEDWEARQRLLSLGRSPGQSGTPGGHSGLVWRGAA